MLLILDDLQWADLDSISLLFHLGRHIGGSRILIACAYRPDDLTLVGGQRHPLLPVIHEFQREWGEIGVDLDQAEGRAFVNAYLDSEPNRLDDEFRAKLYQTAGGNPLFTVELVQRLQERGDLTRDMAGCWVVGSMLDWQKMPARWKPSSPSAWTACRPSGEPCWTWPVWQAEEMLADLYAWFSEGFDLPDLCEAREMLRELRQE